MQGDICRWDKEKNIYSGMYEIDGRQRKQYSWTRTIKATKIQEINETTLIILKKERRRTF